jgi:DNA-3-methyladenine glycosylase I
MTADGLVRCEWSLGHPLETAYHDEEWGVPQRDPRALFELLTLEGAQAGLSWLTILKRRETYRAAFANFDIEAVAAFEDADQQRLLADPGIIRNRAKVAATVQNARAVLAMRESGIEFPAFLWSFTGGETLDAARKSMADVPAQTPESRAMSNALKQHGFAFVGPTICYALMQAAGMVNDHTIDCFRWAQLSGKAG